MLPKKKRKIDIIKHQQALLCYFVKHNSKVILLFIHINKIQWSEQYIDRGLHKMVSSIAEDTPALPQDLLTGAGYTTLSHLATFQLFSLEVHVCTRKTPRVFTQTQENFQDFVFSIVLSLVKSTKTYLK